MGRIIAAVLAAALFLNGCNSIVTSTSLQVEDLADDNNMLPDFGPVGELMKGMPDHVKVDGSTKYDEPGATDAFFIPDTYSRLKADIKSVEFLGVAEENTLVYSYTTKVVSGNGVGKEVHCVAKYNYESKQYQEIYQNIGEASSDLEPFHAQQLNEGNGKMGVSIYDRGRYYYYDLDGNLKVQTSIGDFIKQQYIKNVSTQISSIVSASPTRLYLLLTLQRGEIQGGAADGEDVDVEDTDALINGEVSEGGSKGVDWDNLSDSVEEEIQSRVLRYEVIPIDSRFECLQSYSNYYDAVDYWVNMTEGVSFSDEPDAEEDWAEAEAANSIGPGTIYLMQRGTGILQPIYTWNGEKQFLSESPSFTNICSFMVDLNSVQEKKKFTDSKFDDEDLLVKNGLFYCGISGTLVDKQIVTEEITRTCTIEDENGDTEEITQTIDVPTYQNLVIDKGFLESYSLLKNEIPSLYAVKGGRILASKDRQLFWMDDTQGVPLPVYSDMKQDTLVSYDSRESSPYMILVEQDAMHLIVDDYNYLFQPVAQYKIPFDALIYGYQEGNTEYDQALKDSADSIKRLYSQRERFTEWQVLYIENKGFLIASQKNGLVYYDARSGKLQQLEPGTWMAIWEEPGDNIVMAGFSNGSSGYESKDLIYSKIKKYSKADLIDLINSY